MKHQLKALSALFFSGALILASCSEQTQEKTENTMDTMASKVENGMDNMTASKTPDEDFLSDAVEANTMEIRALALGQKMGGKDVKTHAGHMLADHKKVGQQAADYIAKKNITISVDTANTDMDMADDKAGMDWDKNWSDKMVSDHEKVISMFEDAEDDVKDPELKAWITATLPTLRSHLEMSKQLKDKLSK
jgi:putative membrane protein